eukprot:GHVP01001455.1.p1 GENE.GHVP01001455.1~~GHVP01001455.1.p1  ORF type:complete len:552 (+),score=75.12 GHVP01001455.1:30-1685(+)
MQPQRKLVYRKVPATCDPLGVAFQGRNECNKNETRREASVLKEVSEMTERFLRAQENTQQIKEISSIIPSPEFHEEEDEESFENQGRELEVGRSQPASSQDSSSSSTTSTPDFASVETSNPSTPKIYLEEGTTRISEVPSRTVNPSMSGNSILQTNSDLRSQGPSFSSLAGTFISKTASTFLPQVSVGMATAQRRFFQVLDPVVFEDELGPESVASAQPLTSLESTCIQQIMHRSQEKICMNISKSDYIAPNRPSCPGKLIVTNLQLIFLFSRSDSVVAVLIPWSSILEIIYQRSKPLERLQIDIHLKNSLTHHFYIHECYRKKSVIQALKMLFQPPTLDHYFGYCVTPNDSVQGWSVCNYMSELYKYFDLSGKDLPKDLQPGILSDYSQEYWAVLPKFEKHLPKNSRFRISTCNYKGEFCKSYPMAFIVPSDISDIKLERIATFRMRNRVPILSWALCSAQNAGTLWRCSQPMNAIGRLEEDEEFFKVISTWTDKPIIIFDARSGMNALANTAKGGGYENTSTIYSQCNVRISILIDFITNEILNYSEKM